MTTVLAQNLRQAPAPGAVLANCGTITARNLRRLTRVPTLLALATVQPILLVTLFTYAFGGAGMIDRFRSLPIAPASVLAGRVAADAVRNLFVVGLMIAAGSAIGFRFHAGPGAALAAVALAVAAGIAFSWLNLLLGITVRDAETAGLAGLFPVIILTFTSSTLVPVATMPGWLQAFANINPITVMVGALRALCLGGPAARPVGEALAWIGGLLLLTVPIAVNRYRRAASA